VVQERQQVPAGASAQASVTEDARKSALDEVIVQSLGMQPAENQTLIRRGVKELLKNALLEPTAATRVDRTAVDAAIAALDQQISRQMDRILHHPEFQKLESAWRGLKFLVDRTDFRQNISIDLLNVSKEQLHEDFLENPDVTYSGLYHHVYTEEYGQHGGSPYAAVVANYDLGPGAQDVTLMRNMASVAAMAHAPFLAAAGPQFFGLQDFDGLPRIKDLKATFDQPQYAAWRAFRESEDARYVGLTLPRFLLRLPYGDDNPVRSFEYAEGVEESHQNYLWGNTAFTFATRLTESFAQYGWCPNIIGPQGGGQIEDLPIHAFKSLSGGLETKIPTEILISEPREVELSEQGFIGLTMRKGSNNACFFSANSVQKPKYFGTSPDGRAAEVSYRLGTQLPYVFIVSRLAHYIKVIQRENLGTDKDKVTLDNELNKWIRQFVSDQDVAQPGVRARKPLRQAKITVEDVPGEAGWYKIDMKIVPHFKYMGAFFTLSLVGKLDTAK